MNDEKKIESTFLSKTERLLVPCLFVFGAIVGSRGFYWIVNGDAAKNDSPFYRTLDNVFPLWVWGIPFVIAGLMFFLASVFVVSLNTKKTFDIFLTIGSLISAISFTLLALASAGDGNAVNWLTPTQNTIFAVGFYILTLTGVSFLWRSIKTKRN